MAVQSINIGNIANDGTGDDLRVAFVKVNNNFAELDQRIPVQVDATNLGNGQGVFYVKDNDILQFKTLVGGNNVTLTADANEITIDSPGINNISFTADTGNYSLTDNGTLEIVGGQNIDTSILGNDVTISVDGQNLVLQDTNPTLGGALDANNFNINNANTVNATSFVGDLTGLVYGHDMRYYVERMYTSISGTDYGSIDENKTTGFELIFFAAAIDYGTITAPSSLKSDYGTITVPL